MKLHQLRTTYLTYVDVEMAASLVPNARRTLEDTLLSNNVLCMPPGLEQWKCDAQNGEGDILNGMDAFIHKGAPKC